VKRLVKGDSSEKKRDPAGRACLESLGKENIARQKGDKMGKGSRARGRLRWECQCKKTLC